MTPEEKTVIDEFQGEQRYAEVMNQPNDFLVSESNLRLGGDAELDA
jgi:hypothetical protein